MTIYEAETCVQFNLMDPNWVFIRTISGKLTKRLDIYGTDGSDRLWYREWDPVAKIYTAESSVTFDRYDNVQAITCPELGTPPPQTQEAGVEWVLGLGLAVGGIYYWLKKKKKR